MRDILFMHERTLVGQEREGVSRRFRAWWRGGGTLASPVPPYPKKEVPPDAKKEVPPDAKKEVPPYVMKKEPPYVKKKD